MVEPKHPNQPFWRDEPDPQAISLNSLGIFSSLFTAYRILFTFLILGLSFALLYYLSPILAWVWLGILLLSVANGIRLRRRRKLESQETAQIQQRAFEQTGTSLIGSAIHVAGHPSLEREQNVVLALNAPNLIVYSYESNQPRVIIPLQQISSIQTVVYDDERIPHIDVVDSTAQAIQLILNIEGCEITCLFRWMKKVRPIDWYHAIQRARTPVSKKAG
jgi:hypothetical protein